MVEAGAVELRVIDDLALQALAARAAEYVDAARAPNTKKAYRTDWAEFTVWANQRGLVTMPATPATVALYLTDLAAVAKTSTVERRVASIAFAHRSGGQPSPTDDPAVKAVWAGIRRVHGTAEDQAAPITVPLLRRMITILPSGRGGARDAALLLVGFAGALRRSELVALDVEDLEERHEGVVLTLRRSKPIRKPPAGKSASPTVRTRPPAQYATSKPGSSSQPSPRAPCSVPSTDTDASLQVASRRPAPTGLSGAPGPTPGPIPPTPSVPGWPPPLPKRESPNGPS